MTRLTRWLALASLLLFSSARLRAEKVSDLPAPTSYVSDFAGVLNPQTRQSVEDLCLQVDRQARAQIAVVTIKTLDNDQSVEEFTTELEDKWKVGAKGTDRGVLMVFVMTPTKGRIEVGYGLEGILNDAKVGDIGRAMAPAAQQGNYNEAIPLGVRRIAQVIATDAGVTLTPIVRQRYRQQQTATPLSLGQVIVFGAIAIGILILLASTGNLGILWFILGSLMGGGGGGRGGGGRDDDSGGGFGGFGGGGSGGGGASGDFRSIDDNSFTGAGSSGGDFGGLDGGSSSGGTAGGSDFGGFDGGGSGGGGASGDF